MIYFKPITDETNPYFIRFEAIEDNVTSGVCHLKIETKSAIVDFIDYDEDKPYLVEGLLKSAFNFAAIKNCYMGYCRCQNIAVFLDRMNFLKKNNEYYNDIPSILMGNCCKCADNV